MGFKGLGLAARPSSTTVAAPSCPTPGNASSAIDKSSVMHDFFQMIMSLQPPFNMIVLIVLISCGAAAIKFIATEIRKFGCHRQDTVFKRDMVDRGLSADEIERILKAQSPHIPDSKC
jgi:hypothetical protein